eukprot:m.165698 g.165698  ORF g.165698 m.165698 type:complete len:170 (+) comp18139_c0_seq2:429-938(+)
MASGADVIRRDSGEYGFSSPENESTSSTEIPGRAINEDQACGASIAGLHNNPEKDGTSIVVTEERHAGESSSADRTSALDVSPSDDAVELHLRRRSKSTTSNGSKTVRKWSQTWKNAEGLSVPGSAVERSNSNPDFSAGDGFNVQKGIGNYSTEQFHMEDMNNDGDSGS